MIRVDENDPIGELEPSFPYRDVQIKWNVDVKQFYELQSEIGRGKFGTVYKCKEKATGLALAAKFVAIARRQERKNVEREVEIMRELQHPRLIQIYDAFESSNVMCVVLELIEGGELFERVIDDDFILTEKACTVFVRQICEAVEFIHSKNILHLDMKPENILCLTKTGNRIKIIDFGLARKFDPGKKLQVLFGTPEFVAPEVVNFDQIGFGTDMWSVGVICYVLLSGLSPFMGETDVATMANVTIAMYDFDDDAFSTISEDAKDFIRKLLVKDKEQRMTAMQSLQHSWLRRKPPLQKPTVKRLDSTKDNLRSCVDRWGDQASPIPFIIQSPIVKEIETDEPKLPELLRPSVVIPTNVEMKENTLSPTSPQSPLAKKIKLQETSDETAKTKSSKKSDSKSKSVSVQKSKSSSSSSNSDIEPSDSGSTVNNSINTQALKTSPAGKEQQLNGTSKVTSQNEMPSRNSNSLQVLKSSSIVKGQPLNSTSKESADSKTPISNGISLQVLELTSAGKEQQLNTSNVMTENKATAGISSSPQVIKNNRTGKEQQINGTCKATTENKAPRSNSVNPEVLNTSPVGNGKLLNGNFKVTTESKELSYFGDSLNNRIQCLDQLGKDIAPQLTFNGSQILRQEKMDSGTNIATNFRDNINTKLGESKSKEKSKGGQSDETQGITISCQTAVSDSRVKEDKPITTNHTDQIMSSINACLVEPVVHKSELVNSMKLNNDDLMSRAQSNLPDNVQNTKAQSTLGSQNGPANKNNGHSENSKDLQPKKTQPITVSYSETKTSSNSPSPQTTVTSPLVPSRDSIIPNTVGDWSQCKTLGNNLKEESASAKTVERSKKPAKQLGNNISCLKSIWGSKISANEAKHHPIVKYNRTLSSPASTTAKSRFQGPKPQKLHESEEDSSQIAGSTNCPKVILHRIDVEDADTNNQISSLSTSYNQSSTESRLNVNSAMKNSNNVSNNNKNSSKKPINEWVNEKLLNDRFNIDRRASDISSLVNSDSFYEDNVDCVGNRLAEEISRITDKFCRINDDDDSRGRSNDKSAIIAQERHEKITDLLNGKRRPKYRRLTYLSRDVPVGSPPPPTSLTYYLTNCLTSNSTSPMWPGTGCNFFSAPGTPVGSPRSPSEGSLDTDLIFQMLSQKLKADANLQNNTPPKKTGLINT